MICYLYIFHLFWLRFWPQICHTWYTRKSTWCVLQSRLLVFDSFEVSVTVVFLKMTRSLSSNCPFSFSRHNFASVICCFFVEYDLRFFSFRMSVLLLTCSVSLFLCGFLPLFADFLSPLCLSPFFLLPHPVKRWEAWIWLSKRSCLVLVEVFPRVPGNTLILAWHWGLRMPHTVRVSRWKGWRCASSSGFLSPEVLMCEATLQLSNWLSNDCTIISMWHTQRWR